MINYKLEITDFEEEFELIGIHSRMDDFRLAYFLNKYLGIFLKRCSKDIEQKVNGQEFCFSKYIFEDEQNQRIWSLIENKKSILVTASSGRFFSGLGLETERISYLVPEFKKVDYIFKMEGEFDEDVKIETLNKIKDIQRIQIAYTIPITHIKSKNNLIF